MAQNALFTSYAVLGFTQAQWTNIKNAVTAYLQAHPDQQQIADATLQALDPSLATLRVWNQIKLELGL